MLYNEEKPSFFLIFLNFLTIYIEKEDMLTRTTDEVEQTFGKLSIIIERYMLLKKAYQKHSEVLSNHSQKVMELMFKNMRQVFDEELNSLKERTVK